MGDLDFLGLDENAAKIYCLLLQGEEHTAKSLAEMLDVPEFQVSAALSELSAASLVHVPVNAHEVVHVMDPKSAFSAALAHHRAEIARFQQEIGQMEGEFVQLTAKYEKLRAQRLHREIELLDGHGATQARMWGLLASAEREVLSVQAVVEEDPCSEISRETDGDLINRNVRVRRIYRDSLRNHAKVCSHITWLSSAGGEVRTIPVVPFTAVVVDGTTALLPLYTQAGSENCQTIVIYQPTVISVLLFAFRNLWESGQIVGEYRTQDDTGLTLADRELLRLLANGVTDEAAARKMGISLRTVRRMSASLMGKLGARSRFEAGYRVSELGWL